MSKDWAAIYNEAHRAGHKAATECVPTPMVVGTPSEPFGNDIDYSKKVYYVPEGMCGFAWIVITPGTSSFAKWLRKNGYSHKHYYGGEEIWVSDYGQSMAKKEAYARAFAHVLRNHFITAHAGSRPD